MAIICPDCGSSNPDNSAFCGECGVELTALVSNPAPPAEDGPPPRPPLEVDVPATPASAPSRPTVPTRLPPRPAKTPVATATRLQLTRAFLVHTGSGERFELPTDQPAAFIGKPNEEFPPDVDVSGLVGADIVSRVHALVREEKGSFYLEDAGSSNGTFLNGALIQPGARFRKLLGNGDTISLGKGTQISLRFELEE